MFWDWLRRRSAFGVLSITFFLLGSALPGRAGESVVLPSISAIQSSQAVRDGHQVVADFEATVTYFRDYERTLFVQDGDRAIFVFAPANASLQPGDRVRIHGTVRPSFRPLVESSSINVLRHETLPAPIRATFSDLIQARFDCRLVTTKGIVRSASILSSSGRNSARLHLFTTDGMIEAVVDGEDPEKMKELLDSEVEITGAASGVFDGKWEVTGVLLHLNSMAGVKIIKPANVSPWSLPVTPIERILDGYRVDIRSQRVLVHGTVTYFQPGDAIVLQSGQRSIWIATNDWRALHVGHPASVTGIPAVHDGFLTLTDAEAKEEPSFAPVAPIAAKLGDLTSSTHIFDLISIEGELVTEVHERAQDEYAIKANGSLLTAIVRHPWSAMKIFPAGSRVRVTGICVPEDSNPFNGDVPFSILLRNYDDIELVARPSPLNVRNLIAVIGILLLVVFIVLLRSWTLERKVRRQTTAIAVRNEAETLVERQRCRILEMINSAKPLDEIVAQIASLVSTQFSGAPCWIQGLDGMLHETHTSPLAQLRILQHPVNDRLEQKLGLVSVAIDPQLPALPSEEGTLTAAAHLIAMALETHRLYSDLHHRSEFDQLTEIHNRFSLDRYLEACIVEAQLSGAIFALLYIDLDDFKQVNDRHGHHVGDLFLQEVTRRIQTHLRSRDMLARLGGDEFAIVCPFIHSRIDAEEILARIRGSFEEPMLLEGKLLYASFTAGIALCPENGSCKDALLLAADQAMYKIKKVKHRAKERET